MFADRYRIAHKDRYGVTHQLFIMEDGFSGTVTDLRASGDIFTIDYEIPDERNFWAGQIINTRIGAQVEVTDASVRNFFAGIINQPFGKYRVRYQKDANIELFATLRNDVVDIADQLFPITVKFEASVFAAEKADRTTLIAPRTIIKAIADTTEFDIGITNINNIISTAYSETDDWFGNAEIDPLRLQQYPDGEQPVERLTRFECLTELLPHGHFLLQRRGQYFIYNIAQIVQNNGLNMRAFAYNSSGDLTASLPSFSLRDTVDYNVLPQSYRRNLGGIKRIRYDYNHGTLDKVIPFPSSFSLTTANPTRLFSIDVREVEGGKVFLSGQVRNFLDNDNINVSEIKLTIRAGQRYWNGSEWVTDSNATVTINLTGEGTEFIDGDDEHTAAVSIETGDIPDHINSQDVEITTRLGDALPTGTNVVATQYVGFEGVLATDGIGDAVVYEVSQTDNAPLDIELPPKRYGQGPNVISPGNYLNGGDAPVYVQGETALDARDLGVLVLEEIMATQRRGMLIAKPNAITELGFGRVVQLQDNRFAILLGGNLRVRDGIITNAFLIAGERDKPIFTVDVYKKGRVRITTPPGTESSKLKNTLTADGMIRKTVQVEANGVDGTLSKRIVSLTPDGKFDRTGVFETVETDVSIDDGVFFVTDGNNIVRIAQVSGTTASGIGIEVGTGADPLGSISTGFAVLPDLLEFIRAGVGTFRIDLNGIRFIDSMVHMDSGIEVEGSTIQPFIDLPSVVEPVTSLTIGAGTNYTIEITAVGQSGVIRGMSGGVNGRKVTLINRGSIRADLEKDDPNANTGEKFYYCKNNLRINQGQVATFVYMDAIPGNGGEGGWKLISFCSE